MPFTPDNPETAPVLAPDTRDLDSYRILDVHIELPLDGVVGTSITVRWTKGFVDSGAYYVASMETSKLEGTPLLTAMAASVTAGKSHYDDFRDALWALMGQEGIVPAGTVT